jgi:hypothetical protein
VSIWPLAVPARAYLEQSFNMDDTAREFWESTGRSVWVTPDNDPDGTLVLRRVGAYWAFCQPVDPPLAVTSTTDSLSRAPMAPTSFARRIPPPGF